MGEARLRAQRLFPKTSPKTACCLLSAGAGARAETPPLAAASKSWEVQDFSTRCSTKSESSWRLFWRTRNLFSFRLYRFTLALILATKFVTLQLEFPQKSQLECWFCSIDEMDKFFILHTHGVLLLIRFKSLEWKKSKLRVRFNSFRSGEKSVFWPLVSKCTFFSFY